MHKAGIFECVTDRFRHRHEEELVVLVEGAVLAVNRFKNADLGVTLHEWD
jgi:hypothetical protein